MFRRKNDILLKSAFEEFFADFLRFYIPGADGIFDMSRGFAFMDKELLEIMPEVQRSGGTRFMDLLAKVWLLNGQEEWILVHIEIQGRNDPDFSRRMFTYYYRALDRFNVQITAFAVFTGGKNQQCPHTFERHYLGTSLTYTYNTYHILNHSEQQLLEMNSPFALVILAAQKVLLAGKIPEEELATHRWTIAKALIESRRYEHEKIQRFLFFLKNFIYIENKEINANFEKGVDALTGKLKTMGILETINQLAREEGLEKGLEEGIEKGIEKGTQQTLEKVIAGLIDKFGFTDEQVASVADVSVEYVKEVRAKRDLKK